MENIRQAVERARSVGPHVEQPHPAESIRPQREFESVYGRGGMIDAQNREVALHGAFLESNRIISHDSADPRSKSFDMLRTQILRTMDLKEWKVLGVTSPTPGCGKTVTAINLALSIARQPERRVLLVDMDLQRPQVASCLGIQCGDGLLGILEARATLRDAIVEARIGNQNLMVLSTKKIESGSSEWMASPALYKIMQSIRSDYRSHIVILDMSPMSSDEAISVLPRLDCVLLVAAAGESSVADIAEANKHLQSAAVIRLVLNKAPEAATSYYY
jgi:protein-tyrosine kinase